MKMLEVKNLHKRFGQLEIICGINLEVLPGRRHAIIGPNGAGKTTFFNLISGNYKPSHGEIFFNGRKISNLQPHQICRLGLSRSFQITNVFPGLSVLENVRAVVLSRHGVRFNFFRTADRMEAINQESMEVLQQIGLAEKAGHLAGEMAYGEQRALEIGLVLASNPEMILLDEPTAGMSVDETREAVKLVDRVTRGKTLMIIEHDMDVIFTLADVITVINYGRVLASGSPDEIRNHPEVKKAYLGSGASC